MVDTTAMMPINSNVVPFPITASAAPTPKNNIANAKTIGIELLSGT
jgi:hypothetical protein